MSYDHRVHWRTSQGEIIPIRELSNSHLENCVSFLERKHKEFVGNVLDNPPCFQGEMAQMHAEAEWLQCVNSDVEDVYPSYCYLIAELKRRGLPYTPFK